MGRAGGGGGGRSGGGHSGGGRSGGGFSGGSRSGGGHTSSGFGRTGSGSSGRAGAGTGSGRAGGNMGGGASSPGGMGNPGGGMRGPGGMGGRGFWNFPPRGPKRGFFGRFWPFWGGGGYYRGGGCGGFMTAIVIFLIVLVLGIVSFTGSFGRKNQNTETTVENTGGSSSTGSSGSSSGSSREKIDTGLIFDSNCILDELGWFDDVDAAGESLEDFFDETGVQPYIYFKEYDESLTTDSEKEEYAQQWYEDNIDNEGTFLFIYFAEEDTDNDVGYMYYVCGYDIESVMDEEACELFWDYVDEYWYSTLSTDDMITEIFNSLADAIM